MYTHKKFFYHDWTPLHKTLVYSLVCLYFKQYIVYIIEYVDFPGGVLINSVLESFLQMPLFKQSNICQVGLFLCFWVCRKEKKRRSKVHLLKQDVYKLCKLPLFVSCKRVLLYVTQHCNLQRATAFNCKVSHYNFTLFCRVKSRYEMYKGKC